MTSDTFFYQAVLSLYPLVTLLVVHCNTMYFQDCSSNERANDKLALFDVETFRY